MADRSLYLVFSNPAEGRDDDYNKWYDEVHIPEVLQIPGFLSAQRITQQVGDAPSPVAPKQRYGVIYEIEGDPAEVSAKLNEGMASGALQMTDAVDPRSFQMAFWTPGEKVVAQGAGA
jgi:hypothetical protein